MRVLVYRSMCLALLLGVISVGWVGGSEATKPKAIHVTTTDDVPNTCVVRSYCSLRSAIAVAQPGDKIVIPAGYFHLTTNQTLTINEKVKLLGAGAAQTEIVGNGVSQTSFMQPVFTFGSAANATLEGLTISGGSHSGNGGGISNSAGGSVTLVSDVISDNGATGEGGGIANEGASTLKISKTFITNNQASGGAGIENAGTGTLTMTRSTVAGNFDTLATGAGGGIINDATAVITKSTITNNTAGLSSGGGGGGLFGSGGTLTIKQSTIFGNHAADGGGFYLQVGTSHIQDSTIAENNATSQTGGGFEVLGNTLTLLRDTIAKNDAHVEGGGIQAGSGTTFLQATILGENTASGTTHPDCNAIAGTLVSHDFNVVQDSNTCNLTAGPHDRFDLGDPNLGGLAFNGGPTETMSIMKNASLAVRRDASDPSCNGHTRDQRGKLRPDNRCDSGAFQVTH